MNAILTTSNTIIEDNPYMNIRDKKITGLIANQPALIILDSKLRVPYNSNIFKTKNRLVIIITDIKNTTNSPIKTYKDNVIIKYVPTVNNKISLRDVYDIANTYNLNDILVECGGTLTKSLLEENAIDELTLYVAPKDNRSTWNKFFRYKCNKKIKRKNFFFKLKIIIPIDNDLYINMRKQ